MIVALGLACMMSSPVTCTPTTFPDVFMTVEECVDSKELLVTHAESQGWFIADFKCVDFTKQED